MKDDGLADKATGLLILFILLATNHPTVCQTVLEQMHHKQIAKTTNFEIMLFIFNESADMTVAGDITYYRHLDALLVDIEAIDVINGEYFCFRSDGRKVELSAPNESGPIFAELKKTEIHADLVRGIVLSDLSRLVDHANFGINEKVLEETITLDDAIKLMPDKLISS